MAKKKAVKEVVETEVLATDVKSEQEVAKPKAKKKNVLKKYAKFQKK